MKTRAELRAEHGFDTTNYWAWRAAQAEECLLRHHQTRLNEQSAYKETTLYADTKTVLGA